MSDKYIIKNCPACYDYEGKYGCENNHDEQGRDTYCECITDCLLKQIVDECKRALNYSQCNCGAISNLVNILNLLDIQEVE